MLPHRGIILLKGQVFKDRIVQILIRLFLLLQVYGLPNFRQDKV